MGQDKHGATHRLPGIGLGLDCQELAGRVLGQFWNRSERFFRFKPGKPAGFPDPPLTLPLKANYVLSVAQ